MKPFTLTFAVLITILSSAAFAPAAVFNCPGGDVACLIAAINTANQNPDADTINLAAGTYTLIAVDNDTDGPNGLPSIATDITISAPSAATAIQRSANLGTPDFRILHVGATGALHLNNLTIANGSLTSDSGAGILNAGGTLHLTGSAVSGNSAFMVAVGGGSTTTPAVR